MLLADAAEGQEIGTIEGLSEAAQPAAGGVRRRGRAPVRVLHAGPDRQRDGAARAHAAADAEEVREAMAGNLCRCGAYPKIERAILRAAGGA